MYKVYLSRSNNPYFNLAFEEYLVHNADKNEQVLFLWQNQNTVVIGRNQNPWKECNLQELNLQQGKLVRRLSGGGAVYHDLGNLNFTFISSFSEKRVEENIGIIISALASNGIDAVFSGKNDILVQGYKVSGNAFFVENDILCHHGTLLIDSHLEKLNSFLTVSEQKLRSKGIDSVKARVKNLKELNEAITVETLIHSLTSVFVPDGKDSVIEWVNEDCMENQFTNRKDLQERIKGFESWDWNFGSSPEFNLHVSERFSWGEVDLYLIVKDGFVVDAEITTDALDIDLPYKIKNVIKNRKFDYDEIFSLLVSVQVGGEHLF
ncbi:lipoate--protein ligase [Anaerotignum propionicum]|uniref:lipoate--protein ligase n=1 Tax=Anaerotignum propionicum TaxID=28446 RepID=UPI0028A25561|nr:lipoate--protein ligase [Anaerotignum propionicum]